MNDLVSEWAEDYRTLKAKYKRTRALLQEVFEWLEEEKEMVDGEWGTNKEDDERLLAIKAQIEALDEQ